MPVGIKSDIILFPNFDTSKSVLQYKTTMAKIAPSWIIISKSLTNHFGNFKRSAAKIICPVEEIGKNSDIPSTMERIKACKMFIAKIL